MNVSKNLILGFCARSPFERLEPFIASLRRTIFAGDFALLIEDMAAESVDRLRALGVIVERAAPSAQQRMATMSSRYFSYLDFLVRRGAGYDHVMLADPATSIFQADPFAVPLPTDIVYTGERCRIGETPAVHDAMVSAYGEAVARNLRDFMVSDASTTFGTAPGVLRYLTAITQQLAGRTTPITGAIDQGVHNYVVHMRPLAGAWLDPTDRIAAALRRVPDDAVEIADECVLIDRLAVPVLSCWDASAKVTQYVTTSPRFRLDDPLPPVRDAPSGARDAVIAFYQRQRDTGWLDLFLGSLRCVSDAVDALRRGFRSGRTGYPGALQCTAHSMPYQPDRGERRAFLSEPGARSDRVGRSAQLIRCWCWTVCVPSSSRSVPTRPSGCRHSARAHTIGESDATAIGWPCSCRWTKAGCGTPSCRRWRCGGRFPSCGSSIAGCSSNWSTAPIC